MKHRTDNSSRSVFDQAIQYFKREGKKIKGVYDLLVRGTAAYNSEDLVADWSDLDLSIIVEKIDATVYKELQSLYKGIKTFFPYKLTITLVSKNDFINSHHHHGAKPIYYTYTLSQTLSLLRRDPYIWNQIDLKDQQQDCLSNIAMLIHDLRSRLLKLDEKNPEEMFEFFCHLVKRSKHIIRNAIFLRTGFVDEAIDIQRLNDNFANISDNVAEYLESFKSENKQNFYKDNKLDHIYLIFNIIDSIYDEIKEKGSVS